MLLIDLPRAERRAPGRYEPAGPMMVAPSAIIAVLPEWDSDEICVGCELVLANGGRLHTTALPGAVYDALQAAA